ncbi:MAG TPA: hypothetical protein VGM93_00995 [Acidimicrobiales bacterium]
MVIDPEALAAGVVEERGWRPQLKDKGDQLRLRPPRKLGGALTLVTLMVRLRRDDGGGTILEVRRRRPWWTWVVTAPPLLLGLILFAVSLGGQLWGLVPVAAVAVALGALLPGLLMRAGDPEVIKLADFIATTCDAVSLDDPDDPDDLLELTS